MISQLAMSDLTRACILSSHGESRDENQLATADQRADGLLSMKQTSAAQPRASLILLCSHQATSYQATSYPDRRHLEAYGGTDAPATHAHGH